MGMTPLRTGTEAGGMGHGRIMRMRGRGGQGEFVPGVEGKFRGGLLAGSALLLGCNWGSNGVWLPV